MNIRLHRLDEPKARRPGSQRTMDIAGHDVWLRDLEEEEEFEASLALFFGMS